MPSHSPLKPLVQKQLPPSRGNIGCWTLAVLVLTALGAALYFAVHLRPKPPASRWTLPPAFWIPSPWTLASLPTVTTFEMPMGSRRGAMIYNAQSFGKNRHLGDDLNGIGGKDTDLGDPLYAAATGLVIFADYAGAGWGNVLITLHAFEENGERRYFTFLYGHMDMIAVFPGELVPRGAYIGSVGNAGGRYYAHLHLEMREYLAPWAGPGYLDETKGWRPAAEVIRTQQGSRHKDFWPELWAPEEWAFFL
jgi:hypothetical protein